MPSMLRAIVSWAITLWICFIFLSSLPYKFTRHPDTQHIFGTIGEWISNTIAQPLGQLFSDFGSYVVGGFELITALVLLLPTLIWLGKKIGNSPAVGIRPRWHSIGGLMASGVMAGAVFFHLFTPLGLSLIHI